MPLTTALRSITLALALAAPVALGVAFVATGTTAAVAQAPATAAATYKIDPVHTAVIFRAKHLGTSWAYGRFNDVSGKITYDAAKPEATTIAVTIKADSVDTANAKRDQHLKSPDFFNAAEFPTMEFKSTGLKKTGENTYDLTGELTMLGVTKPISAKLEYVGSGKDMGGKEIIGAEATFTIKRSDFGMNYLLQGLSDDVSLTVSIEAGKE